MVEVAHADIADIAGLNEAFAAWVESVYHRAVHSETNMAPLERFAGAEPRYPSAAELHEGFKWSETRMVTKVATVSLFSNTYEVDAALVGRKVELVFDPFDLTNMRSAVQPANGQSGADGDRAPFPSRRSSRARRRASATGERDRLLVLGDSTSTRRAQPADLLCRAKSLRGCPARASSARANPGRASPARPVRRRWPR